jgi:cell division protein FtsB
MATMETLYVLALELVALFGFLCILFNVLLPVLAFVLRFVLVDVPREWRKWQLHRAQQRELRRLQRRVDALTRRKQTVRTCCYCTLRR